MQNKDKTKSQLLNEIAELQKRISKLEKSGTKLIQPEKISQKSEEFINIIFNNIYDPLCVINAKDYSIISCNKAFLDMYQVEDNKIAGNFCYAVTHHETKPCGPPDHICPMAITLKTGKYASVEHLHYDSSGKQIWFDVSTSPIRDDNGNIHQIIHRAQDISERKQAEKMRLKMSKAIENSSDVIFMTNLEGIFTFINPEFTKLYGHTAEEVVGKTTPRILKSGFFNDEETEQLWKALLNKQSIPAIQYVNKSKDGKHIDVEGSADPIIDDNGNIIGFLGIQRDITKRKQNEKNIKEALIKAEESDRLKSSFLANLSHEIRTPMNAIIGFSNLLPEAESEEKQEEFIAIINSNGEHLLRIINDIIDISKIEAGIIDIENEECNINRIIDDVLDIYKIKNKIKNKEIDIRLVKGFPDDNANIISDSSRLSQILIKLMDNAYKFTVKGKIELGYSFIQDEDNNDLLEFFVKDTGEGIDKNKQKMIFNRFTQEDESATRSHGGTGLGLTISKAIVNVIGGDIWVKSKVGEGSCFYFTIPYQSISLSEDINISSKTEIFDWTNKKILIAEDIDDSFNILENILEKSHVEIIRVTNGSDAVKICRKDNSIDLVLMDIRMPKKTGYEATSEIKKFRPMLPIIAQTAYAIKGDKEKALNIGCDDYLTKPINPKLLIEKINFWIDKS